MKDGTAYALLRSLEDGGTLPAGGHVVESTSGNLGIALAGLCAERGYRCTLAVDGTTAAFSLRQMAELGAEFIHVDASYISAARTAAVSVAAVRGPRCDPRPPPHAARLWTARPRAPGAAGRSGQVGCGHRL